MNSTRERLRRLASAVHARISAFSRTPEPVRLTTGTELFAALDRRLPTIAAQFRGGREDAAYALLAEHFCTRREPRFFIQRERVPAAVEHAREHFPEWASAIAQRASRYAAGRMDVYAQTVSFDAPGVWSRLITGPGNDNLYRVRPHRFSFAPALALAAAYGGPGQALLEGLIDSWTQFAYRRAGSPFAYSSALVAAYRILALSWTMALLPRLSPELQGTVLRILLADIRFIYRDLGKSFPNNHLLADGFICWYTGFVFPEFGEAEAWRRDGEALWLREFFRQIHPDGTSFEHSVHYHEMACEMATAYVLLNRRNGIAVDAAVLQRLEGMLRFQLELGGPEAQVTPLGDATDDPLFPLDAEHGWGTSALGDVYRALFGPAPYPAAEGPARQRAYWLLGGALPEVGTARQLATVSSYPIGGYHVFREQDARTRLLFRTGPRNDAPISAGHMHADLLSVYLTVGGQPFLSEAGTFSYRSGMEPDWRAHFLGPGAHNGLVIDGADPVGPVRGSFRGTEIDGRIVTDRVHEHADIAWVAATDASSSPYGGHRRGVVHLMGAYWLVYDCLPALPERGAHLHLQLAPEVDARTRAPGVVFAATAAGPSLLIASSESAVDVVAGRREPPRGWVSRRYGQLEEAPSLRWPLAHGLKLIATVLLPNPDSGTLRVRSQSLGDAAHAFDIDCPGQWTDRIVINEGADELLYDHLRFRGRLARLRFAPYGELIALDCIATEHLSEPRAGVEVRAQRPMQLSVRRGSGGPMIVGDAGTLISWPG